MGCVNIRGNNDLPHTVRMIIIYNRPQSDDDKSLLLCKLRGVKHTAPSMEDLINSVVQYFYIIYNVCIILHNPRLRGFDP